MMATIKKKAGLFSLILLIACWGNAQTLQQAAPFHIGMAIDPKLLANTDAYRHVVDTETNSITSENTLKWPSVHPSQYIFDFEGGDKLLSYAIAHHKRFHGHCLAWHESIPDWVKHFKGDSAAWENLLKTHINTVVGHYKGKITSWDVVNEAFNSENAYRGTTLTTNNKNEGSLWAEHLGNGFIARAFQYAHEADPKALLFYNEYGMESKPGKLKAVTTMANQFKKNHVPINGLGIQMHININTPKNGITEALKQLAATGLLVHISELDICANTKGGASVEYSDSIKAAQADMFAYVVKEYKRLVPKAQQYGITFWNVSDADSWIVNWEEKQDWPLLFDTNYQKKSCYYSFLNALKK